MPDRRFFDTNVLVYAFAADDPRSARAEALIADGGVIGIQVLNEFTVTRDGSFDGIGNKLKRHFRSLRSYSA